MSNSSNSHTKIFRCVGVHVYRDFNNVFMCLWVLQTAVGYGRFFRKKGQRLFIKTSFQILEFFRLSEIKKNVQKIDKFCSFLKTTQSCTYYCAFEHILAQSSLSCSCDHTATDVVQFHICRFCFSLRAMLQLCMLVPHPTPSLSSASMSAGCCTTKTRP